MIVHAFKEHDLVTKIHFFLNWFCQSVHAGEADLQLVFVLQ
jgi:hypothetical protein